jgi:hypothetical protein
MTTLHTCSHMWVYEGFRHNLRTALVLGDASEGGGAASEAWAGAPNGHDQLVHWHAVQPIQQCCVPGQTSHRE